MDSKKFTFFNLTKTQLHKVPILILLFHFLLYFYYYYFFFTTPKISSFSIFLLSLSLSLFVPVVYSPPSLFFFFFPTTHVAHFFSFFFLFSFLFFPYHPRTPLPIVFFFPFLLLLHKSSVKSLRLLLHPQFRPSSQSNWDPHTGSLGETH